jgi:hypothetical protein
MFSYVSSIIHNPIQHFPSRVYFGPLSLDPTKRKQAVLGPEILVAKLMVHDGNPTIYLNADYSSKP